MLACEVGVRWGSEARDLLRLLERVRSLQAPPPCALPPRQAGGAGVRPGIHTARWHLAKPGSDGQPTLSEIVELAEPTLPSLLPLRAL